MPKPKNPIEELSPELMKEAIFKKDVSFMTVTQREMFDRVIIANDLLKKYRRRSAAIKFMCAEYPNLSSKQIGRYVDLALKIFNHEYKVDWDFMTVMAYDSIMENIEDIREKIRKDEKEYPYDEPIPKDIEEEIAGFIKPSSGANPQLYHAIAKEHANLLKFIGMRPKEVIDESIFEKQKYVISITLNGNTVDLDLSVYNKLSQEQRQNLSDAIIESGEITDTEAEQIFET